MLPNEVAFHAHEVDVDGVWRPAHFTFNLRGNQIVVTRNGEQHLVRVGSYAIHRVLRCGICSTDLARRFLPFKLPQITGHEVVVSIPCSGEQPDQWAAVEINDGHAAHHGAAASCAYCRPGNNMPTQCPARITMGINQWPGGMAPFLIVPSGNLFPIPRGSMSIEAATLVEPFAAALHAADSVELKESDSVAVLGAGKLGLLLIAALSARRETAASSTKRKRFTITALMRSQRNTEVAVSLGADRVFCIGEGENFEQRFAVVFDTTGSPQGLLRALNIAEREVHLKSTHGQPVMGMSHLTEMVVDEITLVPWSDQALSWTNPRDAAVRANQGVYATPSVDRHVIDEINASGRQVMVAAPEEADAMLEKGSGGEDLMRAGSPFPRFDVAVAANVSDVDAIVRPNAMHDRALVRARGAVIMIAKAPRDGHGSSLTDILVQKRLVLSTSRCGDFSKAIEVLQQRDENGCTVASKVEKLVTHTYALKDLPKAMDVAQGLVHDGVPPTKIILNCELS